MRILLALSAIVLAQDPGTATGELPTVRPVYEALAVWKAATRKVEAVGPGLRVTPGDRLGAPGGAYACFAVEGDNLISLRGVVAAEDKGLSLERHGARLVAKLFEGKLLVETFQSEIRVETAHGRIEAKTAAFLVEVSGGKTRVVALDGTLTFSNTLGSVKVEAGKESVAEGQSAPTAPAPAKPESDRDLTGPPPVRNLIRNPGFEEGLKFWNPRFDSKAPCASLDEESPFSGRRCVRLDVSNRVFGPGKKPGHWLGFGVGVELKVGRRYLLRVYLRTDVRSGRGVPLVTVGGVAGPSIFRPAPLSDGTWQLVRGIVRATQTDGRIAIEADTGTESYDLQIRADDFALVELPDLPDAKR